MSTVGDFKAPNFDTRVLRLLGAANDLVAHCKRNNIDVREHCNNVNYLQELADSVNDVAQQYRSVR